MQQEKKKHMYINRIISGHYCAGAFVRRDVYLIETKTVIYRPTFPKLLLANINAKSLTKKESKKDPPIFFNQTAVNCASRAPGENDKPLILAPPTILGPVVLFFVDGVVSADSVLLSGSGVGTSHIG